MSLGHGSGIATDNLIFYYDSLNSKSWIGPPTTNIVNQSMGGMQQIAVTFAGTENGWLKYSLNGTWSGGSYPFSMHMGSSTLQGNVSYSARCLLKTNVRSKFATFGGLNYVNDPNMVSGGTSIVNTLPAERDGLVIIESIRNNFIYSTGYANPTTNQLGYLATRPVANGTSFDANTDFVWVKEMQVERGTFATPYTNTSRSNTEVIYDLTNNNTMTASLSYYANNTFIFNGSNNVISFPENNNFNSQTITVEVWARTNNTNQNGFFFEKGRVNTQYSLFQEGGSIRWRANFGSGLVNMVSITTGNFINTTDWFCLAATFVSGDQRVYINGQQVATGTSSGIIQTNANGCSIGAYGGFDGSRSYWFNGEIGIVKVYNKVLTAQEINQNFQALKGRYGF